MAGEGALSPTVMIFVAMSFVLGTSEFIVIGILPDIAGGLSISLSMAGLLVSAYAITYALGTPVIAALTSGRDRFGLIMVMMLIFASGNIISMMSSDIVTMMVSRVITAAVSGVALSLAMAMEMEVVAPGSRSKAVAWTYAGFSISSVIGVPVGTIVSQTFGWRASFILILIMAAVLMVAMWAVLPRNTADGIGQRGSTVAMMRDRRIILGVLFITMSVSGMYSVYTYLSPMVTDGMGFPESFVSVALMIYGIACIIGNLSSSVVSEKGGLRILPLVFAAETVVLAVLPIACSWKIVGVTAIFLLGVLMYLMNVTNQLHFSSVALDSYPSALNLASSLNPVSFNIGITLGSVMGSIVVGTMGVSSIGYFAALFTATALIITVLLNRTMERTCSATG